MKLMMAYVAGTTDQLDLFCLAVNVTPQHNAQRSMHPVAIREAITALLTKCDCICASQAQKAGDFGCHKLTGQDAGRLERLHNWLASLGRTQERSWPPTEFLAIACTKADSALTWRLLTRSWMSRQLMAVAALFWRAAACVLRASNESVHSHSDAGWLIRCYSRSTCLYFRRADQSRSTLAP